MEKNLQNSFNVKKDKSKQQQQNLDYLNREQIHPERYIQMIIWTRNENEEEEEKKIKKTTEQLNIYLRNYSKS